MTAAPILLASSVIRGSQVGQSHGGLYRIDVERGVAELKLDWNTTAIDVSGRGGDRGLRGIAFHRDRILVAANAQLLLLDPDFAVIESFQNPYLQHCHEIAVANGLVFITATGCDSILTFDLTRKRFAGGWHLRELGDSLELRPFDPLQPGGPTAGHRFHLNSITASAGGMWFSGLYTPGLMYTDGKTLSLAAELPPGTHNAQLHEGGVLFNDTAADRVCYRRGARTLAMPVPDFDPATVDSMQFASSVARPRFARGLCALPDGLIAGGSSPSTVSLYDLSSGARVSQISLSLDVRNAIHGLAVWPYS